MTEPDDHPLARFLGHLAFAILLAIVAARCLMLETIRSAGDFSGGASAEGPGAATSIVLDWLSFVPALLVLARRVFNPAKAMRFAWASVLLAALAMWTLASVAWADDKFLALLSATRIAGGAALFWSATQLVTRWDQLRVIVGLVVGILLVNIAQGAMYLNFDLAEFKRYWAENRAQIFESHGWKETDYSAQRFELKVLAGEMLNFSISANVLGAIVVSCALAAFAAGMQRLEDDDDRGWAGAMFVAALGSIYVLAYTGSKASWAALGLGVALLVGWRIMRGWLARNRTLAFGLGMAAVIVGVAGVITLGLVRHGLPSDSLNFRWRYWIGSWRLFHERPLTGIGWGNFGDAYLRHRLPEATEEIQDPHSFPVKWATELGVIGLTLGLAWLVAWGWRTTRGISPSPGTPDFGELSRAGEGRGEGSSESQKSNSKSQKTLTLSLSQSTGRGDQRMRISRVLLACIPMLLLVLVCTIDFTGDGNYAVLETFRRCVHIALIALAIGLVCLGKRQSLDEPFYVDDRPAPWLAAGLFVAVVMMLVQSTIDIALFQPGPWVMVVTVMGALVGLATHSGSRDATSSPVLERDSTSASQRRRCVAATTIALVAWIAAAVFGVARVVISEAFASFADVAMSNKKADLAAGPYQRASEYSPVSNYDYSLRSANALLRKQRDEYFLSAEIRAAFDQALAAAPGHAQSWLTRSRYVAAQKVVSAADIQQSLDDFARGIALNPNDVDLRIEYADLLERFGRRDDAAAQLETALAMDDKMDPAEPKRLELRSPGKYEAVRKRIGALRAT